MYQVLFAEDELLIRLAMQNSIPWEKYGMCLAAEADNGLQAYELFCSLRPDVVITDLRMEGMNGVELIKKIRAMDSDCAIIVLSCLDDFEILRELIPYRLIGYILKASMTMDEISWTLKKAEEYLVNAGRVGKENTPAAKSREELFLESLRGAGDAFPLKKEAGGEMVFFFLKEKDQKKINSLAMHFVCDLVKRQIPEGILGKTGEREFVLFWQEQPGDADKRLEEFNRSVEGFLGVRFCIRRGTLQENESLAGLLERLQNADDNADEKFGSDQLIQDAVALMHENYKGDLSLSDIAGRLGISPSYFSRLFKKKTGKNYVEFLNEIRLHAVMEDLQKSDFKISVIAAQNGFRNFEYFSRYFKKETGLSPQKWRQENG